jgi:serine/threonine protein phosphatase PrpC
MTRVASDISLQGAPTAPPAVRSCGRSDPGRVRPCNEDRFLIGELVRTLLVHQTNVPQPPTQQGRNRGHLLLVADGMSRHRAGEVASALTVTSIEGYILHLLKRFSNLQADDEPAVLRDLHAAFRQADARILAQAAHHPEFAGMATTLTMAFVSGWRLFVVHAGSGRCYLFRGGRLRQLTTDQTVAADMARRGVIKPEEVRRCHARHFVTNALGAAGAGVEADVRATDLKPGDVLLLCTDGLTDMLADDRIAAILGVEHEPRAACDWLVSEANDQGGRDNITAVVARFDAG